MGAKLGHEISEITRLKISQANQGQVPWNIGVYPKKSNCLWCSKEFTYTAIQARNKKTCSKECRYKSASKNKEKDNLNYGSLHSWVRRNLGKPSFCEGCGTEEARKYHWANKSQEYKQDLSDWIRLCVPCHSKHDK